MTSSTDRRGPTRPSGGVTRRVPVGEPDTGPKRSLFRRGTPQKTQPPSTQAKAAPPAPTPEAKEQSQAIPPTEEKPGTGKPIRVAPTDRPLPRSGLAGQAYRLFTGLGRPDWVPPANQRDQHSYQIAQLEDEVRELVDNNQITVVFVNVKGSASKTTTAVYFGSIVANLTRRIVIALPTTQSTATATLALNAGVSRSDTLTISQLTDNTDQYGTMRELSAAIKPTPFGLYIIAEDPDTQVRIANRFERPQFRKVSKTLYPSVHALLLDTGNDDVRDDSVVLEAFRAADVAVFTGTAANPTSLEKLRPTIALYASDDGTSHQSAEPDGAEAGLPYLIPSRDKALNGVVVVSGVPAVSRNKPIDWKSFTRVDDMMHGSSSGSSFQGELRQIPYDDFIKENVVANPVMLAAETYIAYLELIIATYNKAIELRKARTTTGTTHSSDGISRQEPEGDQS